MIAALLDANVLASGIAGWRVQESSPGTCLRRAIARDFMLIVSRELMQELDRTLRKTYFIQKATPEDRELAYALIRKIGILTECTAIVHGAATHPEDDLILAAAVSAEADYLVTGDRQLLALGEHGGVRIVNPAAFLALLEDAATDR